MMLKIIIIINSLLHRNSLKPIPVCSWLSGLRKKSAKQGKTTTYPPKNDLQAELLRSAHIYCNYNVAHFLFFSCSRVRLSSSSSLASATQLPRFVCAADLSSASSLAPTPQSCFPVEDRGEEKEPWPRQTRVKPP